MAATSKGGDYDAVYKELDKLDSLYGSAHINVKPSKSKTKTIPVSLDDLLATLHDAKRQLAVGAIPVAEAAQAVNKAVEVSKKDIDDRQKEVYNSLNRLGKALDKVSLPHVRTPMTDLTVPAGRNLPTRCRIMDHSSLPLILLLHSIGLLRCISCALGHTQ